MSEQYTDKTKKCSNSPDWIESSNGHCRWKICLALAHSPQHTSASQGGWYFLDSTFSFGKCLLSVSGREGYIYIYSIQWISIITSWCVSISVSQNGWCAFHCTGHVALRPRQTGASATPSERGIDSAKMSMGETQIQYKYTFIYIQLSPCIEVMRQSSEDIRRALNLASENKWSSQQTGWKLPCKEHNDK